MIVTERYEQLPQSPRVIVLGNFDGVHLGHQALVQASVQLRDRMGGSVVVMSFHPHPLQVLGYPVELITPEEQKLRLFEAMGVDAYFRMPFDRATASMLPGQFVDQVLRQQIDAQAVVVGFNFSFGRGGVGTPEFLANTLAAYQIPVTIVPPVLSDGEAVSSTRVRQLIKQGDLQRVAALLGRPYSIGGRVVRGDQRGRRIGFPTANLGDLQQLVLPPFGVYAAEVIGLGYGMANLGTRPSFPQAGPSLEVHIFDGCGDLYGRYLEVRLLEFIREEWQFAGADELRQQLERDEQRIRTLLDLP
ncbi:MAG: riboflavin biosynthesis protein RibF [Bacillota bacterium]|jgi:riboflavin kinase/FMN adenylyltransferase